MRQDAAVDAHAAQTEAEWRVCLRVRARGERREVQYAYTVLLSKR